MNKLYFSFIVLFSLIISKTAYSACPSSCSISQLDGRTVSPNTSITLTANVFSRPYFNDVDFYVGITLVYQAPTYITTLVGIGTPQSAWSYWTNNVACYAVPVDYSGTLYDETAIKNYFLSNAGVSTTKPMSGISDIIAFVPPIISSSVPFTFNALTTGGTHTVWGHEYGLVSTDTVTACTNTRAVMSTLLLNNYSIDVKPLGTLTVQGCYTFTDSTTQLATFDTTSINQYATVGTGTSACLSGHVAPSTVQRYCQSDSTWQSYQASDGTCEPGLQAGGVMIWF